MSADFPAGARVPGFPDATYTNISDPATRQEFENLYTQLRGWMAADHNADGTHSNVRANSLSTTWGVREMGRIHTLGDPEDIPWDPAIYAASGTTTWQPTLAQQVTLKAALIGNLMSVTGLISLTNVGVAAGNSLNVLLPWNYVGAGNGIGTLYYIDAGGAAAMGYCRTRDLGQYVELYKIAGTWTVTAANDTTVFFSGLFPVQLNQT